jgi:hypothetical protein
LAQRPVSAEPGEISALPISGQWISINILLGSDRKFREPNIFRLCAADWRFMPLGIDLAR